MTRKQLIRSLAAIAVWGGLQVVGATAAFAQADGAPTSKAPVRKPPPGYEKFEPAPESEQVDAGNLVVLAYGAVFFGLFGYVVYVVRGQAAMGQEMAELAARLDRVERS